MSERYVLVAGATGNQGNAVTRALLDSGHRVRAMTRSPDGAAVAGLKALGAEIVAGSYDDPGSLANAAAGVDSIFAVTTPYEGVDKEILHGKAIADAANAAGVGHLVYSSVASADRRTGIPHFDSKAEVEAHVAALGVPWTVVAPAYFYDNILFPWNIADMKQGRFRQALPADRTLQQIAVRDIGRFSALVLERRDPFLGRRIDIAGDELTGRDMAAAMSQASGRPVEYAEQPLDEVRAQSDDMAAMYQWFDEVGYSVDIAGLRRDYPEIGWMTFRQWATARDWSHLTELEAAS